MGLLKLRAENDTCARTVVVSPELTIVVGPCPPVALAAPEHAVALVGDVGDGIVRFAAPSTAVDDDADCVVLIVAQAVIDRLGRDWPEGADARFQLPVELRAMARAMLDCRLAGEAGDLYCAAKGVELLCEALRMLDEGALLPVAADATLSRADALRILQARRLIDERWQERLTLDHIAGACGVNREKLRLGFRAMFSCTVAEAIVERRLGEAGRMLASTDLPVSSVGYRSGYLNNASFSRAFVRHFGETPSDYRARRLLAA